MSAKIDAAAIVLKLPKILRIAPSFATATLARSSSIIVAGIGMTSVRASSAVAIMPARSAELRFVKTQDAVVRSRRSGSSVWRIAESKMASPRDGATGLWSIAPGLCADRTSRVRFLKMPFGEYQTMFFENLRTRIFL